jgi:DNA-directed RNA polymerase specialized sigma24 family protein
MSTNREQFDEFVREHREALVRYALVLCRDPHFAQDLVQETLPENVEGSEDQRRRDTTQSASRCHGHQALLSTISAGKAGKESCSER